MYTHKHSGLRLISKQLISELLLFFLHELIILTVHLCFLIFNDFNFFVSNYQI